MIRLFLICLFLSQSLLAKELEKPKAKMELGLFGAGFIMPAYPGSRETVDRFIGLPYFIYRGDFLRSDRDGGIRGIFHKSEDFELDLGFGGSFPTDSKESETREGMPELDWTGEVGPRGKWKLIDDKKNRFQFLLPARYVFSISNFDTRYRGWVLNPEFNLRHELSKTYQLRLLASFGASWGTKKLMEYFYTVEPSQALVTRPAFEAEAGFWGTSSTLFLSKKFPDKGLSLLVGVSLNTYDGSKNEGSPLLNDRYTMTYFLGVAQKLWESKERGAAD